MDELIGLWLARGGLLPITRVPGHELDRVAGGADFAVLPVGAVEWHGPHLPLGTDLILADGFASEVDGFKAVLYPAVAYTAVPGQTRHWPGTIGVRPEVALAYLCDVLEGMVASGFPRVLVVNGHDANMSTVRSAMEWVTGRQRASLLLANWFQLITPTETTDIFGELPSRGHGGAYETAATLAFDPEAVHLSAASDLPPKPKLATDHPFVLIESHPDPWQGWSGHPSLVTPEAGGRVRELAAGRLRELLHTWNGNAKGRP